MTGRTSVITNFGRNIRFRPRHRYTPRTESEVLAILDRHAEGQVRVVASRHAWSGGIESDDAVIDLRHFDSVKTSTDDEGRTWATVGGGCQLKVLLRRLRRQANGTLPSMGLITEQTIAGAISTGTHGSGKHSLSHYMEEIRVAAYDPESGRAVVYTWTGGPELRAARCAIGCMGVILSVRFRCVPRYLIAESIQRRADLEEVFSREAAFPLQQFYLIPHLWGWYDQERRVDTASSKPSRLAPLYRLYWLGWLDVGFHLIIKSLTSVLGRDGPVRGFYRRWFPLLVVRTPPVSDWSERQLIMEHELFRHLEIELFVAAPQVPEAAAYVREVLEVFAGTGTVSDPLRARLESGDMATRLDSLAGTFTHHYPICFRRVLADDTMLSMASGSNDPWYAISFITYVEPRDAFYGMADFLAQSMAALFMARPHWGKYFPPGGQAVEHLYPELGTFRALCRRVDPGGVFRNAFLERALGFDAQPGAVAGDAGQ